MKIKKDNKIIIMPRKREIRSVSPKPTLFNYINKINEVEYPYLSQKNFELLLFYHVIVTDSFNIKKCSCESKEDKISTNENTNKNCIYKLKDGDCFRNLMLKFIAIIKELESKQGDSLYKLVKMSLSSILGHSLLECLNILYRASNKNYNLIDIKQLKPTPLNKLKRYLRNNNKITKGTEGRLVKDANRNVRNFYRINNIYKYISNDKYCQQFLSINELVNDLVIKDIEFTNAKYNKNIKLPEDRTLLYDTKPGRFIMDYLVNKAKTCDYAARSTKDNLEILAITSNDLIQDISSLKYSHLIEMLKPL